MYSCSGINNVLAAEILFQLLWYSCFFVFFLPYKKNLLEQTLTGFFTWCKHLLFCISQNGPSSYTKPTINTLQSNFLNSLCLDIYISIHLYALIKKKKKKKVLMPAASDMPLNIFSSFSQQLPEVRKNQTDVVNE